MATLADFKHGYKDNKLWDAITKYLGLPIVLDPIAKGDETNKPIGHTTHNLFLKCKKTKKLYLVSARQHVKCDLKKTAACVGAKELRMASVDAVFHYSSDVFSRLVRHQNVLWTWTASL